MVKVFLSISQKGDQVFCVSRSKILKKNFIKADITSNDGEKRIINF